MRPLSHSSFKHAHVSRERERERGGSAALGDIRFVPYICSIEASDAGLEIIRFIASEVTECVQGVKVFSVPDNIPDER